MGNPTFIFIPGHVPSSKNSKRVIGKFLVASKTTVQYRKTRAIIWKGKKKDFLRLVKDLPKPYKIGFHFIRKTKAKYDWVNPLQTVQDMMVTHGWIEDDNILEIVPFPMETKFGTGEFSTVDPKNPGVLIHVYKY